MEKSIEQKVREYMEILGVYVPENDADVASGATGEAEGVV